MLLVNNIRDIDTDGLAGKRTLAVRIGPRHARTLYRVLMIDACLCVVGLAYATSWWALLGLLPLPIVVMLIRSVGSTHPPVLVQVLVGTVQCELLLALTASAGLWIGSWT